MKPLCYVEKRIQTVAIESHLNQRNIIDITINNYIYFSITYLHIYSQNLPEVSKIVTQKEYSLIKFHLKSGTYI